jgi:hypothetical protein
MINFARLKKANLTKGGARRMVMNMFYIKFSRTFDGAVDSRSAPVHR